ncbi:response regulator transcription factor [Rhodocytophaga rosea]|uniref:Response regulator transcription factor n=1 Tax=Rhodocytophaga rosea TaxID=2704465 RepID=A0A6C0GS58_9BACT|nr:response regulator transcription factor [Rhodocytophaga rosea]QHT70931.1 response regulator transcription factor [Rhodocytophaga rosea]
MTAPIRLIVADDHQIFVDGLSEVISKISGVEMIATANNGQEVISKLEKMLCDVAILDIHMPVMDGLQTTKIIKQRFPRTKVLILTMNNEFSLIRNLLQAGALGYILKTTGREEFERALRRVEAGLTYFSEAVATELARQYMPEPAIASTLSEREKEIVALVAKEYSSHEIGNILFIAPTTVDTHRRNIMQKIGVKNTAGLVKFALKQGLID